MTEENDNYVTLLACLNEGRAVVAYMVYHRVNDEYAIARCSEPLSIRRAREMAQKWATDYKVEVR